MRHYVGIDLHCNNNFLVIIHEVDRIVFRQRLANPLQEVLPVLEHSRESIVGIAVESTFNWYWLVDGLMEAGYKLHLVNTAAVKQYEGLKHQDDQSDARLAGVRIGRVRPIGDLRTTVSWCRRMVAHLDQWWTESCLVS